MADIADIGFRVDTSGLQKGEDALIDLSQASFRAASSVNKLESQAKSANRSVSGVAPAADRASRSFKSTAKSSNMMRGGMQNASFQLQDMIVQLQGGASASRVMGQQLPQLLGPFGAIGAAAGVVVAGLSALIPLMFDGEDAGKASERGAKAAKEALEDLEESTREARLETDKLNKGLRSTAEAAIVGQIETLKSEMRDLASEQKSLAALPIPNLAEKGGFIRSSKEIRDVAERIAELQGRLQEFREASKERAITGLDKEIKDRQKINRLVEEGAIKLSQTDDALDALEKGFNAGSEAFLEFINKKTQVDQLNESLEETSEKTNDIISDLKEEMRFRERVVEVGREQAAEERRIRQAREEGGEQGARLQRRIEDLMNEADAQSEVSKEQGKATAHIKEYNKVKKEAAQLAKELRTPTEEYMDQLARLRELRPHLTQEEYNRAIGMYAKQLTDARAKQDDLSESTNELIERQKRNEQMFDRMGRSIAGSFEDAIVEGGSFREALAGIEEDILRIVTRQQVTKPLGNAISGWLGGGSGGGGSMMSTIGNFFGSMFSFENGGFTGTGPRSGGVDGKGGFPAIVHPNETVIDNTKNNTSRMESKTIINVNVQGVRDDGDLKRSSGRVAAETAQAANRQMRRNR